MLEAAAQWPPRHRERPLHVGLYAGVVVRHDAISTALRLKLETLETLAVRGEAIRVTVFTGASDLDHPAIHRVDGVHGLFRDPAFRTVDVHVFEFGVHYSIFNAALLIPCDQVVVGVYHNVTPPHLADNPKTRRLLERSLIQRHNLARADHIVCDSEFNRNDLRHLGFPEDRSSVMHLPPMITPMPRQARVSDAVELLYVGRFVAAKGVVDLLEAVARAVGRGLNGFRLTMAGNVLFSSPDCLKEIRTMLMDRTLADKVRVLGSPPDDQVAQLYASSDALVIPSYHEGYCVPVVEALASGCHVIGYDSSNLPYVTGGLGMLVPTGDIDALSRAIEDYVGRVADARHNQRTPIVMTVNGELSDAEWQAALRHHNAQYSRAHFDRDLERVVTWARDRRDRLATTASPGTDAASPTAVGVAR